MYRTKYVVLAITLLLPQLLSTRAFCAFVPGLLETQVNTASDFSSPGNPALGSDVVFAPQMAEQSNVITNVPAFPTMQHIWTENDTWIYTGQIFVPNRNFDGTGTLSFAGNSDDSTLLKIDGMTYIVDNPRSRPVGTGPITLATGWHDIEMRFGNAMGGAGPSGQNSDGWAGWTNSIGFVFRVDQGPNDPLANSTNVSNYVIPRDDGSGNLFRTAVVPEPATVSLMGLASLGLLARWRGDWKAYRGD